MGPKCLTLHNMYQLGFVCRDLERASARLGSRFGIRSFRTLRHSPDVATAHAYAGNMMIELIEVTKNGPRYFVDYIPDDPDVAVFHHHAYRIYQQQDWDDLVRAVEQSGLMSEPATALNGELNVLFVDLRHELGLFAEYVYLTGNARGYYDDVPRN